MVRGGRAERGGRPGVALRPATAGKQTRQAALGDWLHPARGQRVSQDLLRACPDANDAPSSKQLQGRNKHGLHSAEKERNSITWNASCSSHFQESALSMALGTRTHGEQEVQRFQYVHSPGGVKGRRRGRAGVPTRGSRPSPAAQVGTCAVLRVGMTRDAAQQATGCTCPWESFPSYSPEGGLEPRSSCTLDSGPMSRLPPGPNLRSYTRGGPRCPLGAFPTAPP